MHVQMHVELCKLNNDKNNINLWLPYLADTLHVGMHMYMYVHVHNSKFPLYSILPYTMQAHSRIFNDLSVHTYIRSLILVKEVLRAFMKPTSTSGLQAYLSPLVPGSLLLRWLAHLVLHCTS